jgi:hypothetical protein
VAWLDAQETPIQPLLDRLEFSAGRRNWGSQLRLGLFAIGDRDMEVIAAAMRAELGGRSRAAASVGILDEALALAG